jgi:hypothetical protein
MPHDDKKRSIPDRVVRFVLTIASAITRATFQIVNGIIMGLFFSDLAFAMAMAPAMLSLIFVGHLDDKTRSDAVVIVIGVSSFCLPLMLSIIAIVMMFMGKKFITEEQKQDLPLLTNSFDLLFMMYGCFIVFTSLETWLYYRVDPGLFENRR